MIFEAELRQMKIGNGIISIFKWKSFGIIIDWGFYGKIENKFFQSFWERSKRFECLGNSNSKSNRNEHVPGRFNLEQNM